MIKKITVTREVFADNDEEIHENWKYEVIK
jgi:hypothetical protein